MKIANKISLLIVFLLGVLGANTVVGLRQLGHVQKEFAAVANQDVALMEALTAITEYQLEKNILLEKLISIAEEMGFEQPAFARVQYLNDQLKVLHDGFDHYADLGGQAIERAKQTVTSSLANNLSSQDKAQWQYALGELARIEGAHRNYDQLISQMLSGVSAGGFQLSMDDLHKFKRQEDSLSKELKVLAGQVQDFVHHSLDRAKQWQAQVQQIFIVSLSVTGALSLLLAFWIIRRISLSLKDLTQAAQQVGMGNFVVDLKAGSRDEIAEVVRAFNTMSAKLQEFTRRLEEQNKALAVNLEEISQQKKDLEKVNKELDRFVHTVSHDIVGPLTGIIGYATHLQQHYAALVDQRGKDCIDGVRRGGERLDQLIKSLLELTKISRVRSPYSTVAAREIIDAALANCAYTIEKTGAKVTVQEPMSEIVCDRIKMTAVFYNLVNNAIKFSAKKNPQNVCVQIGYGRSDLFHEFFVQDNGIGIDPSQSGQIFEIFKRLPDAVGYEGSGAGLAIVKAAVEDQGGAIRVESQPGLGAKFIFTIPQNLTPFKPLY